ncbi:MAG: IS1595 family transposase [Deltaproteobacteria bacterium]|nr:IS1595 family transposase [Deltaproteobacteria bacterium]
MKLTPPKFKNLSDMAAIDVGRLKENQARKILENIRWKDGITCPHCESKDVTKLKSDKKKKTRDGVIQCNHCRKQFTVTTGTVMHGSHITLRQWVQAFYSVCTHKKGVSALQLQRNLGLGSYRSAWYLSHRIRLAMREFVVPGLLKGTVEVDETYIGGRPRKRQALTKDKETRKSKRGRGTDKAPVMVLVERNGRSVSRPIKNVTGETLKSAIRETVDKKSVIMTDEWKSYRGIGKDFEGGHKVVNHGEGIYAVGIVNTNTAESYFAILKRGVHGTFHHVSKKHLFRYCDEFSFRWNHRRVNDGAMVVRAIEGMDGKRMRYR